MDPDFFYVEPARPTDYTEFQVRRFVLPITSPYMVAYGLTVLLIYLVIIVTQGLWDTDDRVGLVAAGLATAIAVYAWLRRASMNAYHFFPIAFLWHAAMGLSLGTIGNDNKTWAMYALGLACIICTTGSPSWLSIGQLWSVTVVLLLPCALPLIWRIGWERDLMSVAFFVVPTLAVSTTLHIVADREFRRTWSMARHIEHLATHDSRTQLLNHYQWHHEVERLLARMPDRYPNCLIFMDADHFKRINDRYGHATGDRVLATIGQVIRTTVPPTVIGGRLGGEEFALFCPNVDEVGALRIARRITNAIAATAELELPLPTMSIGIAQIQEGESLEQAVNRADLAMLHVKRTGRGRIRIAPHKGDIRRPPVSAEPTGGEMAADIANVT